MVALALRRYYGVPNLAMFAQQTRCLYNIQTMPLYFLSLHVLSFPFDGIALIYAGLNVDVLTCICTVYIIL